MKNPLFRLLTITCPPLPHRVSHMCATSIMTMSILASIIQTSALMLQSIGVLYYGPYYRIAESASLLILSVPPYIYQKKKGKYSKIYSSICAIVIMLGYFEIVITYNEPEEGLLFYSIFGIISLVFIDFLKYLWAMFLYIILLTLYIYIRFIFSSNRSNIISYFDCGYYIVMTSITYCFLFFLFATTLSLLGQEQLKTESVLNSWKLMMRISPTGLIIKSKDDILFFNDKAKQLLEDESLDVTCKSLGILNSTYKLLSHDESAKTFQTPTMKHIYYITKSILFEEKDADIIILNDISKVIECQSRINEQQMMEMLVTTSTHELRTPLHCIKSTLEMVRDDNKEESNEFIDRAIIACEMQELYINDMLDYAKLKKNSISLSFDTVNVNELILDCAHYFILNAQENEIFLDTELPTQICSITADYLRLKQIVFNLISNSLKFTRKGGIILRVFKESENVKIQVEDTGIGIEQSDIPKLFKPFGMLSSTKAQNKSGTGLGLYLCKNLCTLMKGEIQLCSIPNVRTVFTLTFPLLQSFQIEKPMASFRIKEGSTEASIKNEESIIKAIVIDDNSFNCKILVKMLSSLKIDSLFALNGQKALELIKMKVGIKVAFIDLNMPFMNGYELLEELQNLFILKSEAMCMKAYAVSGDSTEETKTKCLSAGFDGLITKPFSKQQLISVLVEAKLL